MFRNKSNSSQLDEMSWEEDLPLTQDQLAIIDGTSTQEQLEVSCNNLNAPISNRTLQIRSRSTYRYESSTPKKKVAERKTITNNKNNALEENLINWSKDHLILKIKELQQIQFTSSGMLVMKDDENKKEKDRLLDELKRLRAELSTVSSEFGRTTESLRSQLLFQTKECDEMRIQLRKCQEEKAIKVEKDTQSRTTSPFQLKSPGGSDQPVSPVLISYDQVDKAVSPNGFPTMQSFHANPGPQNTPRRARRQARPHHKRFSDACSSTFKTPPAKRFASSVNNRDESPGMILDSPHVKQCPGEEVPLSSSRAISTENIQESSVLVRALDEHHARLIREDGHNRCERELARKLVSLQDEMVAEKIDFDVLSQLKTYEKHMSVTHPLSIAAEQNFTTFNSCYHQYVSSALYEDEVDRGPGQENEEDLERSLLGDEIRKWHLVLRLLPCLANHIRLFANELRRRRDFVDSIDGDLTHAANSFERICSLTGSGPMDEFFDVVKELVWSTDDVHDCPQVLHSKNLSIFRKQVTFALRWLLVIHEFCAKVRPWIHGEVLDILPQEGDIAQNVIQLLSNLRFYFKDELPIKRGALDLFTDISREMKNENKIKVLQNIKPFHLLLMSSDDRVVSTLHCFEAMRYLVSVPSFREDFNYHQGRRQCLWAVVFHIVNKADHSDWNGRTYCFLIIQFASLAIAAVRANILKIDRNCSCYRGMYEALASAALSQAKLMFSNSWNSFVIEAVERPLRALLFLLQSQGVQTFEEITANIYPLFALISMLKRIETCRHYSIDMKAAMDVQLINEFDDIDDEFPIGE